MVIDLLKLNNSEEVLYKFGEIFKFGGNNDKSDSGWGMNWDALNDSLNYLDNGGISGTSKKIDFPLKLEIKNSLSFKENDPEGFKILTEILEDKVKKYKLENMQFEFQFN